MTPRVNFTAPGDDNRTEVWRVNTDFSGAETRKGTLRLRSGPGTKYKVLATYKNGSFVQVMYRCYRKLSSRKTCRGPSAYNAERLNDAVDTEIRKHLTRLGSHIALETCFAEAQRRNAEEFIFLGDYLGDLAYPQKTLEFIDGIKKQYPCTFIRGNKEDYWINHKNGKHGDWIWEAGRSGSGMLAYVFDRLTPDQIDGFEKMPLSMTMRYQGFPDFVICHGSPWKTNESMREDFDYIDELTKRLETELTICAHFHIQSKYTRNGKQVINPGAVGVPLGSNGQAQFMMLTGNHGKWETEFVTLPYDRESAIREMDEEKLSEQAPGWYRITKDVLRNGRATHLMTLMKAQELYEQDTGINDWKNIPEEYWNMALEEMKVPK